MGLEKVNVKGHSMGGMLATRAPVIEPLWEKAWSIPNAELVEIKEIGHLPHIESFDQFIKPYFRFLKK